MVIVILDDLIASNNDLSILGLSILQKLIILVVTF